MEKLCEGCGALKENEARYADMEANETLSGYCEMFSALMAKGWSPGRANAYVVARATHDHSQEIFLLRSQLEKSTFEPRAADYLRARNDPVGPASGPATPGRSRRIKRNHKS